MPLTWDLGEVRDFETVCYEGKPGKKKLTELTHGILLATMVLHIPEITKKTIYEFYWRLNFLHEMGAGFFLIQAEGEKPVSYVPVFSEIEKHLGLKSNAQYTKRRDSWIRRMLIQIREKFVSRANKAYEDRMVKHLGHLPPM